MDNSTSGPPGRRVSYNCGRSEHPTKMRGLLYISRQRAGLVLSTLRERAWKWTNFSLPGWVTAQQKTDIRSASLAGSQEIAPWSQERMAISRPQSERNKNYRAT